MSSQSLAHLTLGKLTGAGATTRPKLTMPFLLNTFRSFDYKIKTSAGQITAFNELIVPKTLIDADLVADAILWKKETA